MAHRALLAAPGLVLLFATLACTAAPVGTVGNGTCGATSFGGDCDADASGAWDAAKENITSLSACVARAKGCKMANYVSYSNVPGNADCSWYSQCDMSRLCEDCSKCGIGCPKYYPYQSQVLHEAPAPPPPPPAVEVLPFILQSNKRRGVLIVSKTVSLSTVVLRGPGLSGAEATVLDGTADGETVAAHPGLEPPAQRMVGADGSLKLGPYAVAIVWATGEN